MNCKRFTARTSREALTLVRQAFGEDAVVLSTKPCAEGVEVMAMAPESVAQIERVATPHSAPAPAPIKGNRLSLAARAAMRAGERIEPTRPAAATPVDTDVHLTALPSSLLPPVQRLSSSGPQLLCLHVLPTPTSRPCRSVSVSPSACLPSFCPGCRHGRLRSH